MAEEIYRKLTREETLSEFDDKYCENCGNEITSAREETLALARKAESGEKPLNLDGSWLLDGSKRFK